MEEERGDVVVWVLYKNKSSKIKDFINLEKRFSQTNIALEEMTTWPKVFQAFQQRTVNLKQIIKYVMPD
jgi:hypothetical protein